VQDLVSRYRLPVDSYFEVLPEQSFPKTAVAPYAEAFGSFRVEFTPVIVRLWTIPASAVLDHLQ
jgi:hypothetical protein